jgi:hypothetical protein
MHHERLELLHGLGDTTSSDMPAGGFSTHSIHEIEGHSSSASFLENGEGAPKEGKLSRQDHCRNSSSFIPIFTSLSAQR